MDTLSVLSPDGIAARARQLATADTDGRDPTGELIDAAGGNRAFLEAARDDLARRMHTNVDDFEATAALGLLNRALSAMPRTDPLDWRVRWGQRFRRP